MKIAHLVSHTALNGVATSTKALIDAQLRAGHEVMLVHPRDSWIERQSFAGPVVLMESSFKIGIKNLKATGYPIRDWGRTVVHSHGSRANKLLMAFRIADGVPSVMTAHARLFQIPWMAAHAVVGLSRQTIDFYTRRRLVARRRIHNVPNLFDVSGIAPVDDESRRAARAALGLRPETFLIGSIGALTWRKRQTDMVAVLRTMVLEGHDAELLLIGGGGFEPEFTQKLQQAMADPVLAGRVHMIGHRNDAVDLLPAADMFLCASGVEEAPIAPLEAMARSVPVVSTDVGNMADLIPAHRLLPIGDIAGMARAAVELLRRPDLRVMEGEADRQTIAEKLAPSVIVPKIERIYAQAIASAWDRGASKAKDVRKPHSKPAE